MVRRVDARRLAVAGAEFAAVAFRNVEARLEERITRNRPQHRSHRTDRVAPCAPAAPSKNRQRHERHDGDEEHPEAFDPHLHRIERVAVHAFGRPRQSVVAPRINRREKVRSDAAVGAVRSDQPPDARQHRHDERREHRPAQPCERRGVAETVAVLLTPPGKPRYDVLHHPQRADDRTVDPSEKQGQHHQQEHHADIHSQQGGQELDFRHPPEPRMESPRKVEEQQRDQYEEEERRSDPDFSQHFYLSLLHNPFYARRPSS